MTKKHMIIGALMIVPFLTSAQQTKAKTASSSYTSGKVYYGDFYDEAKKYTVIKLVHNSETITEEEKNELASLRSQLSRKNIEVIEQSWKDDTDLKEFFKKQNIDVTVNTDDGIFLKGNKYSMSTTAKKVLLIMEDGKPKSLCSGTNCETNTKYFFNLIAFN